MKRRAGRDYVPLATSAAVLLVLLTALPSTLNLPQTNPSDTLEYAPVPPEGDEPPPAAGNLSSLGLGSTGGLTSDGTGETPDGPGGAVGGVGKNPSTKRCIGNPPRQTEDRLSPPCVAHFSGDNFGATYQGVSKDEIRILFYIEQGGWVTDRNPRGEQTPRDAYVDLLDPTSENEHVFIRALRAYQRHFNERYQTYGRTAHFFAYFTLDANSSSAETRRADAIANYREIKPFAVISYIPFRGDEIFYVETMARKGVLNFGTFNGRSGDFYRKFPALIWGYEPAIEQHAASFVAYLCKKVVPHPVSFSGNPGENGQPRRLGLLWTTSPQWPALQLMAQLVRQGVEECGGTFVAEGTYEWAGRYQYTNEDTAPGNMAKFRAEGVTTIIWPGGMEVGHTHSAGAAQYRPEWVLAGDRLLDGTNTANLQNQSVFLDHAWVVSTVVALPPIPQRACTQAWREADTTETDRDVDIYGCRPFFNSIRQLFTGIQVAGPRLDPSTIDRGFHAIPRVASTDPGIPACFYEPGDYTCVKDAVAMWYTTGPSGQWAGCWRIAAQGGRFLADGWPEGDVLNMKSAKDSCSLYNANI